MRLTLLFMHSFNGEPKGDRQKDGLVTPRRNTTRLTAGPAVNRPLKNGISGNPKRQRGTKPAETEDSNPSLMRRVTFFNGLLNEYGDCHAQPD